MFNSGINMDDGPYALFVEEKSSQNGDKGCKWTKTKKKALIGGGILLLLIVVAVVVVRSCTHGGHIDVLPTSLAPPTTNTTVTAKSTESSTTLTTPKSTTTAATTTTTRDKITWMNAVTPKATVASTTTVTTMASVINTTPESRGCDSGFAPILLLQHNATVGKKLRSFPASSLGECSDHCMQSKDCFGVEHFNNTCSVFVKGLATPENGTKVLTKACVESKKMCSAPFHFAVFHQRILVEFTREVVSAETIEVCLAGCLNAIDSFGFICESAMFYPVNQECFLNSDSRLDSPDLFLEEEKDTVIFMDNNCARPDHTEDGVMLPTQDPASCPPAFIRRQQTRLVGFRAYTIQNVPSVGRCLEICTNPSEAAADFVCKSLEYYINERECILHSETSETGFFYRKSDDWQVDHYDVTRYLKNKDCPEGTVLRSIHVLPGGLPYHSHPEEAAWTRVVNGTMDSEECVCM